MTSYRTTKPFRRCRWPARNAKTSPTCSPNCHPISGSSPALAGAGRRRPCAQLRRTRPLGVGERFAKGGFLPGRVNAVGVTEYATRSPEQLTELMRACIPPRGLTAGFGGMIALADGMIHQQDIRRPVGIPRVIPRQRLHAVLNFALTAPAVRGAKRAGGVRLVATDLDWSHGSGPEVRGAGEAILMAMAARPSALADLTGPGKATLARNIGG